MKVPILAVSIFSILLLVMVSSRFNGEVLRKYLPSEVSDAVSLYNERDFAQCAVSIYEVQKNIGAAQLPLSKPEMASSEWFPLPVKDKVDDGSYAVQALFDGNDCFDDGAKQLLQLKELSDYYLVERRGFFLELRGDLILIHDLDRNVIVISARS